MDDEEMLVLVDAYQRNSDTSDADMIRELVAVIGRLGGSSQLADYLSRDHSQED